jgi:hypothetical protein
VVQDRVRVLEAEKDRAARDALERNDARAQAEGRRSEDDRQATDQEAITRALAQIRELRTEGKLEDANRLAGELVTRYPGVAAVQSSRRTTSLLEQLAAQRQLRAQRDRGLATAQLDVQRSATPALGDVEFPKDWAEKTKTRTKNLNPLTAKEKLILQTLASAVTVNFKNSRFEDVVEYLSTITRQPILLDKAALDEANVTYDSPVTVNVKGVALRTLLRKVLSEFGLTYVIKDETIQVVSASKAKDMMITRSYYIGDVIAGLNQGPFFGTGVDQLQTLQNVKNIMDLIQGSVEPSSWQSSGGLGAVTFNAPTMSLIIRQSAEVHSMLSSSLSP